MAQSYRVFEDDAVQDFLTFVKDDPSDKHAVLLIKRPLTPKQIQILSDFASSQKKERAIVLACGGPSHHWKNENLPAYVLGFVSDPSNSSEVEWGFQHALRLLELQHENEILRLKHSIESTRREQILKAAIELSDLRNPDALCERILTTIREITAAEGASLYLASADQTSLSFKSAQNEKISLPSSSFSLPIDENSMAGACALRRTVINVPDVNNIPSSESFRFNKSLDESTGYRTKAVVSIPLVKQTQEVVGVIQIINSKRFSAFSEEDIDLARALSAHIAVALETALLYQEIENLFEGFIQAAVTAIESRDPTTSGHSERVAQLTVHLAEKVSESGDRLFKEIQFETSHIKEIRYAALLHDFGKIGVPESVLLKEKKLYPEELKEITRRITILKLAYPAESAQFEELYQKILKANEPTVKDQNVMENLSQFIGKEYDVLGQRFTLLEQWEWEVLSITKGSLTLADRQRIESHVTHTYRFLKQIPWSRNLKNIPEIAHSHHEKLDGTGYPRGLKEPEIRIESQMMAIADIYDALTASDRPYKKALPVAKALDILNEEAARNKLNKDLVQFFKEQHIYRIVGH